jgi:hypothetical protein
VTRVDIARLSTKHQAFVKKNERHGDEYKKPRKAKPKALGEEFDSPEELNFAMFLQLLRDNGEIDEWRYHPLKFRIAKNCTYEPDFITRKGKEFTVYEVKGSWKQKGARDSRTRLEVAAFMYQWFSWKAAICEKGVWCFEPIHSANAEVEPMD